MEEWIKRQSECSLNAGGGSMNGASGWYSPCQRGVEYVFVLCGNGLQPFLEACHGRGSRLSMCATNRRPHMADLWGRMTGRLGVVRSAAAWSHQCPDGLANMRGTGTNVLLSGCSEWSTNDLTRSWTKSVWSSPSASMQAWWTGWTTLSASSAQPFHATAHRQARCTDHSMDVLRPSARRK